MSIFSPEDMERLMRGGLRQTPQQPRTYQPGQMHDMGPNHIGGVQNPNGSMTYPPLQAPAPQAAAPAQANYANRLESWNTGKLSNAQHKTPKYQAGRVFQNFDPTKGTQQAMLDQLNALGIGQFSGKIGGDKLRITNPMGDGWGNFRGGEIDYIRDLGRGGYHWGRNLDGGGANQQASAVSAALGGGGGAFSRGFAGNAPYAASSWLSQLLQGLGVKI